MHGKVMWWWFVINIIIASIGGVMWHESGFFPGAIMVIAAAISEVIQICVLTGGEGIGDIFDGIGGFLD